MLTSADNATEAGSVDGCCSNCGKAEVDEIKLNDCDKCDLARYCSDECQEDHREAHEAICKARVAALRDEVLFQQPGSSHRGDCPICCLPLPNDPNKQITQSCCCKIVCRGCAWAYSIREIEQQLEHKCPFCRQPLPKSDKECKIYYENRAEANDPIALRQMGHNHYLEEDYESALKYWARAAELGSAMAHHCLAYMYREGDIVEKNEEKAIYHAEEAAIAGHPDARYNLGLHEWDNERHDRAVKHWIIAANLGDDDSLQRLKECYKDGCISKDDYAAALRAYQAAVDATKSPQREEAEEWLRRVET